MREIEFDEKNFPEVIRLASVCENSTGTDRPQQIHFNEMTRKFEHYPPEEYKDIPQDMVFEHPINAINHYKRVQEEMDNAITETDNYIYDEETDGVNETDDLMDEEPELAPTFSNDDEEVLRATSENLQVISNLQKKLQTEQREKLARIIGDIYKCDTISESDVARCIVENDEYKKLLSMLFGMLGVTVSSTKVTNTFEVSSGTLKFNERITYDIADYRRGAAQCLADVRRLAESGEKIKDLEETNRELNSSIVSIRKELTASNDKYTELQTQRAVKKDQNLLNPIVFTISWKKGDSLRFLKVKSNAKTGEDGSYPTKYLEKTAHFEKATTFSEEQAKLQLARLIKHKDNLTFVDLKNAGSKEVNEFFSVYRTTIEKV